MYFDFNRVFVIIQIYTKNSVNMNVILNPRSQPKLVIVFSLQGCQFDTYTEPILYYDIGASDDVAFFFDGVNVIGTYVAADFVR